MSKVINLFKLHVNNLFKVQTVDTAHSIISRKEPNAARYLREIKLNDNIHCCAFKDIGNPDIHKGKNMLLTNYRFSMITLPGIVINEAHKEIFTGLRYVDYTFYNSKLSLKEPEAALTKTIQGLALFSFYNLEEPPIMKDHFCNHVSKDIKPFPCLSPATSFQSSNFKPFHLFKVDTYEGFFTSSTDYLSDPYPMYLIPFMLSEGVVIYYTIVDDGKNDIPATLETLAMTVFQYKDELGDHWCAEVEVVYNDNIGIFTCTKIGHAPDTHLPIKK